ncbi:unnamed protein product [Schistosoma turkestanicum]|nr:unnamed protein product [Schistosoma turkestanicum]
MYRIYFETYSAHYKIYKCNRRHVHNSLFINFDVKEDRVDCVALFNTIIMITPNEIQHSRNVNAFQSVATNLYHSNPAKMAAITATQSHCTRPSSVPGCFAHREDFSVSIKNQLSPVNSDNLSPYGKISPIYQLSLSPPPPPINTCNEEYISPDLKDSAVNHEIPQKDYVPTNSPQSTLVISYSGREGCMPSPFHHHHHSNSPHCLRNSSVVVSNSPPNNNNNNNNSIENNNVIDQNSSHHSDTNESLVLFDFPKLLTKSDGSFIVNWPTDVILPKNTEGQEIWNDDHQLHLINVVIITVVDQNGQILYYEKNLSNRQHNLCLKTTDGDDDEDVFAELKIGDSWSSSIQDDDLTIWKEHTSKIFHEASRWFNARNALLEQNLLSIQNDDSTISNHDQQTNSNNNNLISAEKNSCNRHLFDCPIYRMRFGQKWFNVHTFSLPVNRCCINNNNNNNSRLLQSSNMSLCELFVVHYHNVLCEYDQSVESTGSNIAQCTVSMNSIGTDCPNSHSSTCEEPTLSHLVTSTIDNNHRIGELSSSDNKNLSVSSSNTCLSHTNSPDTSVAAAAAGDSSGERTLVFKLTSSPSSSRVLLPHHHHHHVHLTHHHHHHPSEIDDATTTLTSTINNNPLSNPNHRHHDHHHHHHYVRHHHHHHPPDNITSHDSPQSVIISHFPHDNSFGEQSTESADTSHRHMHDQRNINVDNVDCCDSIVVHHNDSMNYPSLSCRTITNHDECQPSHLLDPSHPHHHHHLHHHHHHHPLIHTGEHLHHVNYHPCSSHQNDKSTLTEFVPTSSSSSSSASSSIMKSNSSVLGLNRSKSQSHSEHSSTTMPYENVNMIGTFCDNNNNNNNNNSNSLLSDLSSDSVVYEHGDTTTFVPSNCNDEFHSHSNTYHYNRNNNSDSDNNNNNNCTSIYSTDHSRLLRQNNEIINSGKQSSNDDNPSTVESFHNPSTKNDTVHGQSMHTDRQNDSCSVKQRSLNKNQYDRRILMLQHLLPPQAIQEIRQIWQEMNKLTKIDTEISRSTNVTSIPTTPATATLAGATNLHSSSHPPPSNNVSSNIVVRESFARQVRQIVRQYLGPKAFSTDNFTSVTHSRLIMDSGLKTTTPTPTTNNNNNNNADEDDDDDDVVMVQLDNKNQQSSSMLIDCDELPKHSTSNSTANVIEETNNSFTTSSIVLSTTTTTTTIPSTTSSLCGIRDTTTSPTSEMFSSEMSHNLVRNNKTTASAVDTTDSSVVWPNVTATSVTSSKITNNTNHEVSTTPYSGTVCNSSSGSSSLPSCIKQTDQRIVSQSIDNSGDNLLSETPYTSSSSSTTSSNSSDLPRVSTNSQCCMLEWLLSEEADLCILPPSLCSSKNDDKLQQQQQSTSGISSVVTSCCQLPASSQQIHHLQYSGGCSPNTTITEKAYSPISTSSSSSSMCQQKFHHERSLLSSNHNGSLMMMTTTTTTVGTTSTSTTTTTVTSSTNLPYIEIRSASSSSASAQPRTESLLVRLLHPTKNHTIGHHNTDMNTTYDVGGHLSKFASSTLLSRSVATTTITPTSQSIPETMDFNTPILITNTPSDINNVVVVQRQLIDNRKSDCRLSIAVSLDNLCNSHQPTMNNTTTTSKRCRSGPVTTTQSILSPSNIPPSTGNKRTRHASQFEEPLLPHLPAPPVPPASSSLCTRNNSGTSDHLHQNDVIPSPPFTSLTQLLLQDFPLVSDMMLYSSMDNSPKYTGVNDDDDDDYYPCKSIKSSSSCLTNEQNYAHFQSNPMMMMITNEESTRRNQDLFTNANNVVAYSQHLPLPPASSSSASSSDPPNENTLSTLSWSTSAPNSNIQSKLDNNDKYLVMKISKQSDISCNSNSINNSMPGQSSLCQLLLNAQLEPDEITCAVANVEYNSNLPLNCCETTYSTMNNYSTISHTDKNNEQTNKLLASNTSNTNSSCAETSSSTSILAPAPPQPLPTSSYSIAPVEWNDDDLQQLIHEAITNPNETILDENNNPLSTCSPCSSSSSSLLPKRHPSTTSSKEISEEVEILCEILRRDELERSSQHVDHCDTTTTTNSSSTNSTATTTEAGNNNNKSLSYLSESPSSKRSRFSSSTSMSDHQTDTVINDENAVVVVGDGELINYLEEDDVNWQNDAKAVARICEQLQQGLVTEKLPVTLVKNNSNTNTVTELSGYSSKMNNTSYTSTSSNNVSDYLINHRNDMSVKYTAPAPNPAMTNLMTTTCTTWSTTYSHPMTNCTNQRTVLLQRRHPSGNNQRTATTPTAAIVTTTTTTTTTPTNVVNKAAVAAALASQQAAASQRNQLTHQRLLAEQRKRLIQHQLYNQVAIYSLNNPSTTHRTALSNSDCNSHMMNTFFVNENIYGIQNLSSSASSNTLPVSNNNNNHNHNNPTYQLLHVMPNKSINRKSLPLDTTHTSISSSSMSSGTQNFNTNLLNLNATTVNSLNSSAFNSGTTSRGGNFHPPPPLHHHYQHPPEDLSRYLKEVGPNIQVQLSYSTPTMDNHQLSSNNTSSSSTTHQLSHGYSTLHHPHHNATIRMQKPSIKHQLATTTTTTTTKTSAVTTATTTTPCTPILSSSSSSSVEHNAQTSLLQQSGMIHSLANNSSDYYTHQQQHHQHQHHHQTSTMSGQGGCGSGSSSNLSKEESLLLLHNQKHFSFVNNGNHNSNNNNHNNNPNDNSCLVKAELRQALVDRQGICQKNSVVPACATTTTTTATTTITTTSCDNNHRNFQYSQVSSNQFSNDPPPPISTYQVGSSPSSSTMCCSISSSCVSRLPLSSTSSSSNSNLILTHNQNVYSNLSSTGNCSDWSIPQPIYNVVPLQQHQEINSNLNNNNNNCVYPQSIHLLTNHYHPPPPPPTVVTQVFSTNQRTNDCKMNAFNYFTQNDTSSSASSSSFYCNNDNNNNYYYSNIVYPLTPPPPPHQLCNSLSPISSVSANTSPSSSTTSQPLSGGAGGGGGSGGGHYLKSPPPPSYPPPAPPPPPQGSVCQSSMELTYSSACSTSLDNLIHHYYEITATNGSLIDDGDVDDECSTFPTGHRRTLSTTTSSSIASCQFNNSHTTQDDISVTTPTTPTATTTTLIDPHLESIFQSKYKHQYYQQQQHQQQQQEENLLPDDLINDVFDLEIMIATKHQQQQQQLQLQHQSQSNYHHYNSTKEELSFFPETTPSSIMIKQQQQPQHSQSTLLNYGSSFKTSTCPSSRLSSPSLLNVTSQSSSSSCSTSAIHHTTSATPPESAVIVIVTR